MGKCRFGVTKKTSFKPRFTERQQEKRFSGNGEKIPKNTEKTQVP